MSKNNQRKRKQAEWDFERLPTRAAMIKQLERLRKQWQERKDMLELAAVCKQEMCARKDWAVEYVRMYECTVAQLQYAQQHIELLEKDLSELYSGATKGWPLRKEVNFFECYPQYADGLRGGYGSAHMGAL